MAQFIVDHFLAYWFFRDWVGHAPPWVDECWDDSGQAYPKNMQLGRFLLKVTIPCKVGRKTPSPASWFFHPSVILRLSFDGLSTRHAASSAISSQREAKSVQIRGRKEELSLQP